jgi:hypothetical protein
MELAILKIPITGTGKTFARIIFIVIKLSAKRAALLKVRDKNPEKSFLLIVWMSMGYESNFLTLLLLLNIISNTTPTNEKRVIRFAAIRMGVSCNFPLI